MTPVRSEPELADRILGGWLGRIAGNMLGKPVEQGDLWTRDRIDRYLRRADALPLTDYLPEPMRRERRRRAAPRVAAVRARPDPRQLP